MPSKSRSRSPTKRSPRRNEFAQVLIDRKNGQITAAQTETEFKKQIVKAPILGHFFDFKKVKFNPDFE